MKYIKNIGIVLLVATAILVIPTKLVISLSNYISKYELTIDKLSETNLIVLAIQVLVTSILSYMIYSATMESNRIAKHLSKYEFDKDEEDSEASAFKVYYELNHIFEILIKQYLKELTIAEAIQTDKLKFSENWIDDVRVLRKKLGTQTTILLYNFYRNFDNLQEGLAKAHDFKDNELPDILDYAFDNKLLNSWINSSNVYTDTVMKNEFYLLMLKLRIIFDYENIVEDYTFIKGESISALHKLLSEKNGKFTLTDKISGNQIKYNLKNGEIVSYIRKALYKNNNFFYKINSSDKMHIESKTAEGKSIYDGLFDDGFDGEVMKKLESGEVYIGGMKNDVYHGLGKIIKESNIIQDGVWDNGVFIEGYKYKVLIENSEGYNYFEQKASFEKIEEENNDPMYLDYIEKKVDIHESKEGIYYDIYVCNGHEEIIKDSKYEV